MFHLSLVSAALVLFLGAASASRDLPPPPPMPCNCSDVDPRATYNTPVQYTCLQQRALGSCNASFMFDTVEEVPEGYCQITCNRCTCCKPVLQVVQDRSTATGDYKTFLRLAALVNVTNDLNNPGFEWTIFVPSDQGFQQTISDMGQSNFDTFQRNYGRPGLQALLRAHVIPPTPGYVALSTPFFADGHSFATSAGQQVRVQRPSTAKAGDGSFRLASINSVGLDSLDVPACKSNVIFLDKAIQIDLSSLSNGGSSGPAPAVTASSG